MDDGIGEVRSWGEDLYEVSGRGGRGLGADPGGEVRGTEVAVDTRQREVT